MTIKGGGPTPNGKTILNFHFDYLTPSLSMTFGGGANKRGSGYMAPLCNVYAPFENLLTFKRKPSYDIQNFSEDIFMPQI